ncbi:MAG: hypothetical protein ACKN85_01845 [Pirellula sp.]
MTQGSIELVRALEAYLLSVNLGEFCCDGSGHRSSSGQSADVVREYYKAVKQA